MLLQIEMRREQNELAMTNAGKALQPDLLIAPFE